MKKLFLSLILALGAACADDFTYGYDDTFSPYDGYRPGMEN